RAAWNAKAGKAGGALDRRVSFFRVCSGAPHPLTFGGGKRDGQTPSPTKPGGGQARLFDNRIGEIRRVPLPRAHGSGAARLPSRRSLAAISTIIFLRIASPHDSKSFATTLTARDPPIT